MKIRILALLIASFGVVSMVQAANLKAVNPAVAQRDAILQKQARGAVVTSNSEQYQVLPGVRASMGQAKEKPVQTLARVGGSQLVETKGDFVVYTATPQGSASLTQANGLTTYPTVINSRTGGVGILPGSLNVKLKNMANAAAVGATHGLELVRQFDHLQVVFYRVQPGQDVVAAAASLAADGRVVSAEVEVIEHMKVPN